MFTVSFRIIFLVRYGHAFALVVSMIRVHLLLLVAGLVQDTAEEKLTYLNFRLTVFTPETGVWRIPEQTKDWNKHRQTANWSNSNDTTVQDITGMWRWKGFRAKGYIRADTWTSEGGNEPSAGDAYRRVYTRAPTDLEFHEICRIKSGFAHELVARSNHRLTWVEQGPGLSHSCDKSRHHSVVQQSHVQMRQISWSNVVKSSSVQNCTTFGICISCFFYCFFLFALRGPLRQSHCLYQDFGQGRQGREGTRKNKFQGTLHFLHCPKICTRLPLKASEFVLCYILNRQDMVMQALQGGWKETSQCRMGSFMSILWKGKLHVEVNILIFDFRACRPHFWSCWNLFCVEITWAKQGVCVRVLCEFLFVFPCMLKQHRSVTLLDPVRKSVQRLLAPLTEAFYLLVGLFASARRGIAARALTCFEPQWPQWTSTSTSPSFILKGFALA